VHASAPGRRPGPVDRTEEEDAGRGPADLPGQQERPGS
jgi:hypothetical protein